MKYYKAPIVVENSSKRYGNLPLNFVTGYETDTDAYFQLIDTIPLPESSSLTEIDENEFTAKIQEITQLEKEKRKRQEQDFLTELKQKQQTIEDLISENTLLKAQNHALTETTEFHEELIVELAMMVYQ